MLQFPSVEWLDAVAVVYRRGDVKRLGYVEATLGVQVEDGGRADGFVLVFDGYGVRAYASADPAAEADVTIAGDAEAWREMLGNIAENGAADLRHTLNRLTMAGTPLRLIAADQLKQDEFFRFNQSYQAFFDASAQVGTQLPALAPA
jgi:fermentation-respiration switch protein FrsA (DUF1100 family)